MHRTNVKDGTSLGIREVSKMHHDESSQPKAEKWKQPSERDIAIPSVTGQLIFDIRKVWAYPGADKQVKAD